MEEVRRERIVEKEKTKMEVRKVRKGKKGRRGR